MPILHSLLAELKAEFAGSEKAKERGVWFLHTLLAIILPFTSSKTSNLLRVFHVLFGFAEIGRKRYYTFIASPKIPWDRLWPRLWRMIPQPETNGRLIVALDDYLNPKTGKKIFIKGRWACLPLSQRYYFCKDDINRNQPTFKGKEIAFQNKHQQAVEMLAAFAGEFPRQCILVVADSWFGNQGLWKPLRKELGTRAQLLSRLRANNNLYALPDSPPIQRVGRPSKYGHHLGTATSLAKANKDRAQEMAVNLYGRKQTVLAYRQTVMQKTLKCRIQVVWVYRRTRWIALFTTDLSLSTVEIIEYYGARWKIEAGFKELKQDIGSAETQNRNPVAVKNHLNLCMMATSLTWVYACHLNKTPSRRHAVKGRNHFAFSDVRRLIAQDALDKDFQLVCPLPRKPIENSFAASVYEARRMKLLRETSVR